MHWAERYILADWRWAENGQGPDEWNCWAFVRHVLEREFGRSIPPLPLGDEPAIRRTVAEWAPRREWRLQRGEPVESDLVLMRGMDLHIGMWIEADGGGVLHCQRDRDVTFDNRRNLELVGFRIERIWTWRGN